MCISPPGIPVSAYGTPSHATGYNGLMNNPG